MREEMHGYALCLFYYYYVVVVVVAVCTVYVRNIERGWGAGLNAAATELDIERNNDVPPLSL